MWGDITAEEAHEAFDRCAEEVLWECGVTHPPVDAALVAMRLGLSVAHDNCLPSRAALVRLDRDGGATDAAVIVLGEEERYERLQFSMAHEIGEFTAPRLFERLRIAPYDVPASAREKVANAIAGRLLVPTAMLKEATADGRWDLTELKQHFATASHELIARRMLDMSPSIVISLFDQGRMKWRRTNRRFSPGQLLPPEVEAWQDCHQLGVAVEREHLDTLAGRLRIQCWPIHEPGWKREIMRVEIVDWE